MDPPVSEPIARSQTPAATRAADPPEEPPEVRSGLRGLRVSPISGWANPAAYSRHCVVANTSAPAARSRVTRVASATAGAGSLAGPGDDVLDRDGLVGQGAVRRARRIAERGDHCVQGPAQALQPLVGGEQVEGRPAARASDLLGGAHQLGGT